MAIKVKIPSGVNSVKINELHQWDYGQILEIEDEDLLSLIVEAHFSYSGLTDAIVHNCNVENGIVTVAIPDVCLEQTTNITVWMYEIDGTEGRTTKSITIPMIGRARPNRPAEIPQNVSDAYTELITEVNEAVKDLKNGNVVIRYAENADRADTAALADVATTAKTAQNANTAEMATFSSLSGEADYALRISATPSALTESITTPGYYYIYAKDSITNNYVIDFGLIYIDGKHSLHRDITWTDGDRIRLEITITGNEESFSTAFSVYKDSTPLNIEMYYVAKLGA